MCQVQIHLEKILVYLDQYSSFINCHMVNYLTDDLWNNHIPIEIREEIQTDSDIDSAIQLFWEQRDDNISISNHPNFLKFLKSANEIHFDKLQNTDVCQNIDELNEKLRNLNCNIKNADLHLSEFMTAKKNHEVEITAQTVAHLCTHNNTSNENITVIDAGDGKGYLSSRLALEHNLRVLGVDANSSNTKNAEKRNLKLKKAWNGLTVRAKNIKIVGKPERLRQKEDNTTEKLSQVALTSKNLYRTTTAHINSDTDLISLVKSNFPEVEGLNLEFCLTGLHACGNLTPNCLKIFLEKKNIKTLCVIGCCYHLLVEEFSKNEFFSNNIQPEEEIDDDPGFPMSNFLKQKKYRLGRNARMLSLQSIHRIIAERELPSSNLFYRSLFELLKSEILHENDDSKVGRIGNCIDFNEYMTKVAKKVKLNLNNINSTYFPDLEIRNQFNRKLLNLFYLIRLSFAPILETLIMLDRYLYLKENNIKHVFLVKLFDPVVSPRCFGIVALK